MKRSISFLLAVLLCCSLILSALPTTAGAICMDFIPDRSVPLPAERKISLAALERMALAADDELVPVSIWLRPLPQEALEAIVPMEKPSSMANESTPEERDAWARAEYQTRRSFYYEMTQTFAGQYFDETVQIDETNVDQPGFKARVKKSRIAELAALDEVIWINEYGRHIYLLYETPAQDKIAPPLLDYMQTAAPDERVPIRLWLRGEADEEAAAIAGLPYPTLTSPAEEVQAYRTALRQAYREQSSDPMGVFARNHLDEDDEILYSEKSVRNQYRPADVPHIGDYAHREKLYRCGSLSTLCRSHQARRTGDSFPL